MKQSGDLGEADCIVLSPACCVVWGKLFNLCVLHFLCKVEVKSASWGRAGIDHTHQALSVQC